MSFFGFDPTANPAGKSRAGEVYDFENTYDGLGELDEDDAFNDETFGTKVDEIRKDFSFGSGSANQRQGIQQSSFPAPSAFTSISYAQAAVSNPVNDDEFMQDLWGSSSTSNQQQHQEQAKNERKILSLAEIEAQLTAIDQGQQSHQPQQSFPPQPYGIPGMMPPPQFGGYMMPGFMPPQYGFPGGVIPPQMPIHQQPSQEVQQQQQQQPQQQSEQAQIQSDTQKVDSLPNEEELVKADEATIVDVPHDVRHVLKPNQKVADLSNFPVLGSKEAIQQQQLQQHQQQLQAQLSEQQHSHHHRQPSVELTPEQEEKARRRQEKVSRIMKYSGIMNPKDKDFVTRFQLSQIVTDDPYNEDFYAQVFKVIHPKVSMGAAGGDDSQQNNSIAQAYLDHSGHRLGGRYKRADVALQRMQQQVQKAVTVAKERPKLTQFAKEGALGKISFSSGKKPRQQLEIISKAAEREKEGETKKKEGTKHYSKKDILGTLENIISELMNVESETRTSSDVDTSNLWESLKVLEQHSSSGDDESEVNPFIQCLNYNKMLKILSRLFKFLTREQVLTIVTLIMSNLENLLVIKNGSYTTYSNNKVPEKINNLIESYTLTFTKILMNSVLDFKFNEIIGLLIILIEHNNVSFVSTTKIGLSILTTLLSRAELIIGEGSISATDLSEWTSCYDELFTSLESRIAAIFPPNFENIDDGSSKENYIWQFLATLSLGGKLNHQRIIVDEVRDEIFSVMNRVKAIDNSDLQNLYKKQNLLNNLNMYLVVMGLVADENEIKELQQ